MSCRNFRHWSREGVDRHIEAVHPDVAAQSLRLRAEHDKSLEQMTGRILALRLPKHASTDQRNRDRESSVLADSIKAIKATGFSQSPSLDGTERSEDGSGKEGEQVLCVPAPRQKDAMPRR